MKKLIALSSICIIASILFSSCGSNMSLTKRHYNNGYYIAHTKGKQTVSAPKEEVVQVNTKNSLYAVQKLQEQNTISGHVDKSPIADNSIVSASNEKVRYKVVSQPGVQQIVKHKTLINANQVTQIKTNSSDVKKLVVGVGREGLSLFWIIILVILILWAVGFLGGGFGLGAFINLLLLVALILLILWLLRIV